MSDKDEKAKGQDERSVGQSELMEGLSEPQFERRDGADHVDEFSYHEVLDRASIIADMFEEQILQHTALIDELKMRKEATKICESLHKFYQHWGSVRSEKFR